MDQTPLSSSTPESSRKMLFIGIGAVIALILVIALVGTLIFGTTERRQSATATTATTSDDSVVTREEVDQNLKDLNAGLEQAKLEQENVKEALEQNQEFKVD